jgi:4-amino-4-deoxy-L-arabinose transferase-like glycosyltransferase
MSLSSGRQRSAFLAALALLTLLAVIRVVATYRVFAQTADEHLHVLAGYEWWVDGRYEFDAEHPPLARIGLGLAAALDHPKTHLEKDPADYNFLERHGRYRHNLAAARVANLPFLLLGLAAVTLWALRLWGRTAALLALALFSTLPPFLAHSGLATTDAAAAATMALALYAFARCLDRPTRGSALFFALALGAGLLAKYSFIVFFPLGVAALLLARLTITRRLTGGATRSFIASMCGAAVLAAILIWAGYLFAFATLRSARERSFPPRSQERVAAEYARIPGYEWVRFDLLSRYYDYAKYAERHGTPYVDFVDWAAAAGYPSPLAGRSGSNTMIGAPPLPTLPLRTRLEEPIRAAAAYVANNVRIPAPTFLAGAELVARHSRIGHTGVLFGEVKTSGWWYYFPVLLLYKSPLPFVILTLIGLPLLMFRGWRTRHPEWLGVAIAPTLMLVPAMTSGINIGVRHVLPLYPLFALCAVFGALSLWRAERYPLASRAAVVILLAWQFVATAIAHPDYLPYMNELAVGHPERIALDSNVDWGQDYLRLEDLARRDHLQPLHIDLFSPLDWHHRLPSATQLEPGVCTAGWIAISEMKLTLGGTDYRGGGYEWLKARKPVKWIGKSIRLYQVKAEECR